MNRLGLKLDWRRAARKLSSRVSGLKLVFDPRDFKVQGVSVAFTVDPVDLIRVGPETQGFILGWRLHVREIKNVVSGRESNISLGEFEHTEV